MYNSCGILNLIIVIKVNYNKNRINTYTNIYSALLRKLAAVRLNSLNNVLAFVGDLELYVAVVRCTQTSSLFM